MKEHRERFRAVHTERWMDIVVLAVIVFSLAITLFVVLKSGNTGSSFLKNEYMEMTENEFEMKVENGSWEPLELPGKYLGEEGKVTLLKTTLNEKNAGHVFLMSSRYVELRVLLEGEVIKEYHRDYAIPFSHPAPQWILIPLPENCEQKTLVMELTPFLEDFESRNIKIFEGSELQAVAHVIKQGIFHMLVGGISLVFGISFFVVSIFLFRTKLYIRTLMMSLFAICIGGWIFIESLSLQVYMDRPIVYGYICLLCYYMIPIALCRLLMTYDLLKNSFVFKCIFAVSALSFIVVNVLQMLKILYLIQVISVTYILFIAIMLGIIYEYCKKRKAKQEIREGYVIYLGGILSFFGMLDMLYSILFPPANGPFFSRLGALAVIGFALVSISGSIREKQKNEIYREMAYRDMVTGLANRSAFEKTLKKLREEDIVGLATVLIADLDNMKMINDGWGHQLGDDVLKILGDCIKKAFYERSECFRIGGDEFCVISDMQENELSGYVDTFHKELEKYGQKFSFPLDVILYYETVGCEGIDACLKNVEQEIRQIKRQK